MLSSERMHDRGASQPLSARRVAADVLNQVDPARQFVHTVLEKNLGRTEQRQRCTDLVLGVVRNRRAIDAVTEQWGRRPISQIDRPLVNVIRVAVFELVYCPLTAVYAIVDDAVEVVKGLAGRRQAGFVNALMRQVTGHLVDRQALCEQVDSSRVIPTGAECGCVFDEPFLPDPAAEAAEYLSVCFSLPRWLARDWIDAFGYGRARHTALASSRRPSLYLRPNTLRTTTAELVTMLGQGGIDAAICDDGMIRLSASGRVERIPGYAQGLFTVQDPVAASAVRDLRPAAARRILDLCAAPGGKTIHLAEATEDRATIVATDVDALRLKKLQETACRLGIRSVRTIRLEDLDSERATSGGFDLVLVDAPCSNSGVMARRPEVRYRLRPEAIAGLVETQVDLLERAAGLVTASGRIGYSTCSIQGAEDAGTVQVFLQGHPEFELESERLTLPAAGPFDHDGGYVAVLERASQDDLQFQRLLRTR